MVVWKNRVHFPLGSDGWYLCDVSDRPDGEVTEFRGADAFALQWVNQFMGDIFASRELRRLLGDGFPPRSDSEIAGEVAARLVSGFWKARRPVVKRATSGRAESSEVAAPFPRENRRPARTPTPEPEGPSFPADVDPLAIAEAQKRASALGVPFCEECLKSRLARV